MWRSSRDDDAEVRFRPRPTRPVSRSFTRSGNTTSQPHSAKRAATGVPHRLELDGEHGSVIVSIRRRRRPRASNRCRGSVWTSARVAVVADVDRDGLELEDVGQLVAEAAHELALVEDVDELGAELPEPDSIVVAVREDRLVHLRLDRALERRDEDRREQADRDGRGADQHGRVDAERARQRRDGERRRDEDDARRAAGSSPPSGRRSRGP
jgi:hypothetical protein